MLTCPIVALLLLSNSATTAEAGRGRNRKHRKLLDQKQFKKDLYGKSKRSAALRQKFISKSTFVGGRRLQNYNNYNNNYNNNYRNNNYNNNYNQQANANEYQADEGEAEEDEAEDAVVDDEYGYDDQYVGYEQFDGELEFNPSNFALSYHRCAAVQQFDDQVAASGNTNSVFATRNFAIFRFCPVATCDAEIEVAEDDAVDDAVDEEEEGNNAERKLEGEEGEEEGGEGEDGGEYAEEGEEAEEEYQGGARGRGCRKNYGEYMIELEDYLQIMAEHQEKRTEEFCQYCEELMWEYYEQMMEDYQQEAQNAQNGNYRRDLKFEDFKDDLKDPNGFHARILEVDIGMCAYYQYTCNRDDDSLTEYFECKQSNGAYIGPHCAEDGFTVTLGAFADDECNQYIGGDVANYLGDDLDEDALKPYYNSRHGTLDFLFDGEEDSVCIPCQKVDDEFEEANYNGDDDDANDADDGNANEEEEDVDYGDGEMSELCEIVYESSAHCSKHYKSFRKGNLSSRQWQEMKLSCSFIESIEMNNYDEFGYVNLDYDSGNGPGWLRDNMYANEYGHVVSDVSPLQVFFLIFTILACIILAVWSKTLHSSLTKKDHWAPRREWKMNNIFRRQDAPDIGPADSGIGASRVRSDGTSYYVT